MGGDLLGGGRCSGSCMELADGVVLLSFSVFSFFFSFYLVKIPSVWLTINMTTLTGINLPYAYQDERLKVSFNNFRL